MSSRKSREYHEFRKVSNQYFRDGKVKYKRSEHRPSRRRGNVRSKSRHATYRNASNTIYNKIREIEHFNERELRRKIKLELAAKYGLTCAICGKPIASVEDATVDHIIPLFRGGKTTIENCQLAHAKCNKQKGSKYDTDKFPSQKYRR